MNTEAFTVPTSKPKLGRPKERPEGEQAITVRLPIKTYRLLKGLSYLNGLSINKGLTVAIDTWAAQWPALVEAVNAQKDSEPAEAKTKKSPPKGTAKKKPAKDH